MKKLLLAGLLVWVPLLITAWVLLTVVGLVDKTLLLLPAALQPESLFGFYVPGLGFVLTFGVLLVTGLLYTNFIGAWLFKLGDRILSGIPLLKVVYTSVKQISDTLLTSSGKAFRESVLVPYPHPGVWALGFVTGNPPDNLASSFEERMVAVYVPTAPSPASGYVIIVPENSLRPSGMTVDEALKYIVSLGVVTPPGEAAL
ncbi:MAG TPA: DUF502 domain-containing protein [Limnobacter sp.]|uniref:DUF502 domain-containing protein n=1 Tax=Limnobacter sp. TaxID=2003368 RepID=UPI002ED970DF